MRPNVVRSARAWIGTPYRHQGSVMGAGCDCLGLLRGVWRDVLGAEPQTIPAYTQDWSEPERTERLWQAARRHLEERPAGGVFEAGEVLLFRMRAGSVAKHLGIVGCGGPEPSFIHAYSGHAVLESSLTVPWRRRIAARFAFPKGAM
ncbi:MAG: NlpC/P60 family putative phage cell wall peptidase [Paracoccaceae bacterium]|jgi:NlpC/P60 family putative phage cell wall peptidase